MREPLFYRKRPVVIRAIQYTGDNIEFVEDFVGGLEGGSPGAPIIIETLEGDMTADVGDWIIEGIANEYYPCKPTIFEATYEGVD